MYTIKIADYVFGIDNRYEYVHWLCEDYIVEGIKPDFCVSVSAEEIENERKISKDMEEETIESFLCMRKFAIGL